MFGHSYLFPLRRVSHIQYVTDAKGLPLTPDFIATQPPPTGGATGVGACVNTQSRYMKKVFTITDSNSVRQSRGEGQILKPVFVSFRALARPCVTRKAFKHEFCERVTSII